MKDSQLEKLSVKELRDLSARVEAAITSRMSREKTELKEKWAAMAAEAGLSLADVMGGRKGGRGKAVGGDVKYRHTDDPTLTWSGRGRKPKWLSGAGGNIERFRVG